MPHKEPPAADEVAQVVHDRLQVLDDGINETVNIEWRGVAKAIPVITMPVSLLSFNPGTHRVRAQRTLDPERDAVVEADPFGPGAQQYLRELLRGDPKDPSRLDPEYEALRDDLAEHGQTEPGVITRAGVLINGNTRCAALQELGRADIRVGVLPPDAAHDDFVRLELSLQLRKEYKRQYSFVNFLLAIDEQLQSGKPPAVIQRDFRIKQPSFDRSRWVLDFIREAIRRSEVRAGDGTTHTMRLVDFEDHQGKLEELYRSYVATKARSPQEAEALKESRLIALALSKSKTDLRFIEPDFYATYLEKGLSAAGVDVAIAEPEAAKIPGLSVTAAQPERQVAQLAAVADKVLKAQALAGAGLADPQSISLVAKVGTALDRALDLSGRDQRLRKRRLAPADRLSDANDDIEACLDAIRGARAVGDFRSDELDDQLIELRHNLRAMAQLVERVESSGEGIAWLTERASK